MQTQNLPIHRAYKASNIPLWVTPEETRWLVLHRNYAGHIADELAEWMARRLSMCFAAGYLGHEPPVTSEQDVHRMLSKMGYAGSNLLELAGLIVDNVAGVYRKGAERRNMTVH